MREKKSATVSTKQKRWKRSSLEFLLSLRDLRLQLDDLLGGGESCSLDLFGDVDIPAGKITERNEKGKLSVRVLSPKETKAN